MQSATISSTGNESIRLWSGLVTACRLSEPSLQPAFHDEQDFTRPIGPLHERGNHMNATCPAYLVPEIAPDAPANDPGAVSIRGTGLSIDELIRVARDHRQVVLSQESALHDRIQRSYAELQGAVARGETIYGVTTGFGGMANVLITPRESEELQDNMLWYHKAGAGGRLPGADVRAAMLLRANSHLRGASGLRPELIQRLLTFLNAGVTPHVPDLGSIGASGDLIPLTYITGSLIGHEAAYQVDFDGQSMDAREALRSYVAALPLSRP